MPASTILERLKRRVEISGDEMPDDIVMEDIIESAQALFLSLRYPTSSYPTYEDGEPVIEKRWHGWIYRCAIEMLGKVGIEGQVSSTENSTTQAYDSGTVSVGLIREITPVVGVSRR